MGNDLCCACQPRKYVVDFNQCFDLKCTGFVIASELKRIGRIHSEITFNNTISENYDHSLFRERQSEEMKKFYYYNRLQVVLLRIKELVEEATIPTNSSKRGSMIIPQSKGSNKNILTITHQSDTNILRSMKRNTTIKLSTLNIVPEVSKEEESVVTSTFNKKAFVRRTNTLSTHMQKNIPEVLNEGKVIESLETQISMQGNMSRSSSSNLRILGTVKGPSKFKQEIDFKECIKFLTEIFETEEHYSEEALSVLENSLTKRLFKTK
jgi:hypothetical protein